MIDTIIGSRVKVPAPEVVRAATAALSRTRRIRSCRVLGPAPHYPVLRVDGRSRTAHRVIYEAFRGPIPPGRLIRHLCHRRNCLEPSHLVDGSPAENSRDMVEAGRSARGTMNPKAKLTPRRVRAIRREASRGSTWTSLARRFDVSRQAASMAGRRVTWAWLP
jgi:hypothetical protein